MKVLSRFMRSIGVLTIIIFCAASIFFSFLIREIQDPSVKSYISYASFFENRFYDFRMKYHLDHNKKNKEAILVKIDDESLQTLGTWPINRESWAQMINNLGAFGAKIVAFDVMFPEEVKSCGKTSVDDTFANSIKSFQSKDGNKIVLAYTVQTERGNHEFFEEVPDDLFNFIMDSQQSNDEISLERFKVERHTYPIKKLLTPMPDLAYINMLEDSDGIFRHYQLVVNVDDLYLPSLAMRSYESYTGESNPLKISNIGNGEMVFDDQKIFINHRGETKVRWLGSHNNFDEISLHKVVNADPNDKKMTELFKDRAVFIGSTATGAHDLRHSPIDSKMPGIYSHMNMFNMLRHQYFYKPLDESVKYSFCMLAAGLFTLLFFMRLNRALLDVFVLIFIGLGFYFIDYIYFIPEGYELRLFFVLASMLLSYSWITFINFNQANQEKKQIKGAFSSYVSPAIVDEMLDHPDKLKVGGERKDITCLFSDVRDFTSISEQLSANELAQALNRYMGQMTDIVYETKGTLDKYIGDAIVAFWGAPLDIGDHVDYALDASVKMIEALPAINKEFKTKGTPEFKIGIGLNSGECNVGNMGSDQIFAYTALGDNMNLGARLESLCKHYGAQILISEFTYERMNKEKYQYRIIDKVRVKGKTQPIRVYEVLYSYHPMIKHPDCLKAFKKAYQYFLQKDFSQAIQLFNQILEVIPEDKASNRLKSSCMNWLENPPLQGEDHTITTMTEK